MSAGLKIWGGRGEKQCGKHKLPSLVEIGLTDLPTFFFGGGGYGCVPCPPSSALPVLVICFYNHLPKNYILQTPQYLMIGGSIVFTFSALTLVALWTPCKEDDICVLCLFPLVTFIMFCINIWGAAVVFGKLKPLLNTHQNFKKKNP